MPDQKKIAALNDACRTHRAGQHVMTRGIAAEGLEFTAKCIAAVAVFNDFTDDNDPFGEHDFGAFTIDSVKCFWKIDIYADTTLQFGSEHPDDPTRSFRVMTLMLAEEY